MLNWLLNSLPLPYPDAVVVVGTAALGFVAGALGPLLVLRRRAMFGDAMSHATLPGVAIAFLLAGAASPEYLLLGAAASASAAALAMTAMVRSARIAPDAAIGVVLSVSLTLGLVLLTHIASTGDSQQAGLNAYLLGQAAGMVEQDIALTLTLGTIALGCLLVWFRLLRSASFDPGFSAVIGARPWIVDAASTGLLAVAIVLGVRTVGAILMVALLVAPCVAARQLTTTLARLVPLAGLIGAVAGVAGGVVSGKAELPAGPVIVLIATTVAVLAVLFAPRRGVVARRRTGGQAARDVEGAR
ncbi:metal ABC transporter permease [Haloechinothrix sp. YIM 98757]|uniref:Metal ABC transporter permease n=1 Tax=Haloechinothrix aidingensis TaxID=2752311 RepID=A0A838A4L4_9PSEU|nr:metal ABC transporter permease [Haloechinothrix aidingensis]MBA0124570.1 metal ABC transporter permease [Haloechinothrix aidingensis]